MKIGNNIFTVTFSLFPVKVLNSVLQITNKRMPSSTPEVLHHNPFKGWVPYSECDPARNSHHLVAFLHVKLCQFVRALLESRARHDGQVDGPAEVHQILFGQVLDLTSQRGFTLPVYFSKQKTPGTDINKSVIDRQDHCKPSWAYHDFTVPWAKRSTNEPFSACQQKRQVLGNAHSRSYKMREHKNIRRDAAQTETKRHNIGTPILPLTPNELHPHDVAGRAISVQ